MPKGKSKCQLSLETDHSDPLPADAAAERCAALKDEN